MCQLSRNEIYNNVLDCKILDIRMDSGYAIGSFLVNSILIDWS